MISRRFAAITLALLALASIPTVIHSYRALTIDDGLKVQRMPEVLEAMPSKPTNRRASWVESNLASSDWFERTYKARNEEVRLFVGRSYDAKRLYHHPELALLRDLDPESSGLARLPGRPDVPIRVLTTSRGGRKGIAVYALVYDGRYVEKPVLFQIETSLQLLFSGRKAMTLFMASDLAGSPGQLDEAPAVSVLTAAIKAFEGWTAGHGR